MIGLYRAFSTRTFGGGLVFLCLGAFFLASPLFQNIAARHVIYIIPVLVSPVFVGIGIWMIAKSTRALFCERCRIEVTTKTGKYLLEQESIILKLLKNKALSKNNSPIHFAEKDAKEYLHIGLTYCPACVSIGSIQIKEYSDRKRESVLEKELQGNIVRGLKDTLYL